MEKIGIVDVGGGLRGIYPAGVFDYLLDNKIYLPYAIGVSAGSANVASYTARQRGRNKVFYEEYSFEKKYMSFSNFLKSGSYIGLDYVYGTLSNEDGKNPWDYDSAMKSSTEMCVVMSNAKTGEPEYIYKEDYKKNDYGMLAGSCCMPIVCKVYKWHGKEYYDGGITDPIPVKKAFADGCTRVIVILTREINYRKVDSDSRKRLYQGLKKKYPEFTEKLTNRCETYNQILDSLLENEVKQGKVLIVAPEDTSGLKTLTKDVNKLEELYQCGYKDGEKIKKFIEMNENK